MTEETFIVGDMHCDGCERTIRTMLGDVDGVEDVEPDHRTNTVAVRFDESRIGRRGIAAGLAEIGYTPTGG